MYICYIFTQRTLYLKLTISGTSVEALSASIGLSPDRFDFSDEIRRSFGP